MKIQQADKIGEIGQGASSVLLGLFSPSRSVNYKV